MQFAHGVIEIHGCLKDSSYRLRELLDPIAAVVLLGPRQTGKTTLAFTQKQSRSNALFELPYAQRQLDDPAAFFMHAPTNLPSRMRCTRMPGVFSILRGVIDQLRRLGESSGQFLSLGSASGVLLQQSSESLAGRVAQIEDAVSSPRGF